MHIICKIICITFINFYMYKYICMNINNYDSF